MRKLEANWTPRVRSRPPRQHCGGWTAHLLGVLSITVIFKHIFKENQQIWRPRPLRSRKACKMNPHFAKRFGTPISQHLRNCMNCLHRVVYHLSRRAITNRLIANKNAGPPDRGQTGSKNWFRCNTHNASNRQTNKAQRSGLRKLRIATRPQSAGSLRALRSSTAEGGQRTTVR